MTKQATAETETKEKDVETTETKKEAVEHPKGEKAKYIVLRKFSNAPNKVYSVGNIFEGKVEECKPFIENGTLSYV